jgi:hypothetical protein
VLTTGKMFVQRLPIVRDVYGLARDAYVAYLRRYRPSQDIFRDKFARNAWRGAESVSGTGSDLEQTRVVVRELPRLLRTLRARTILDVPCGDFHWMRTADLSGVRYVGGDVVPELIERNRRYEKDGTAFRHLNLLTDALPTVDVVFCRDCLVHLSFADINRALKNICRSGSTYLVTTTFEDRTENQDIPTGRWRVLNLQIPPFNFPPPLHVIREECTEGNGKYRDKSLAVWRLDELRPRLE